MMFTRNFVKFCVQSAIVERFGLTADHRCAVAGAEFAGPCEVHPHWSR